MAAAAASCRLHKQPVARLVSMEPAVIRCSSGALPEHTCTCSMQHCEWHPQAHLSRAGGDGE